MKTLKHPQFLIPIIIIIIMLGWIGYQKINVIKIKQAEKQAAEQNVEVEDADTVDENTDESLSGDLPQKIESEDAEDALTVQISPKTEQKEEIDTSAWNSFTHRAYNYTIKFPKNWHWDGTDADVLIISSESIKSNDENLTANNLKIIKADQEIIEEIFEKNADAEIANLNDNFKAAYLKNHQFKNTIEQIIKSFEI